MFADTDPEVELPFATSLCHRCANHRYSGNRRGSVFILCQIAEQKYLPQPVLRCASFQAEAEGEGPS